MTCHCDEEAPRLYATVQSAPSEAITTLRERVGEAIDADVRDSLRVAVHDKAVQLRQRCGSVISQVKRLRVATHFCYTFQPGLMVDHFGTGSRG